MLMGAMFSPPLFLLMLGLRTNIFVLKMILEKKILHLL